MLINFDHETLRRLLLLVDLIAENGLPWLLIEKILTFSKMTGTEAVIESPISLAEIWSMYDLIVGGNRERCREEDVEDYKLEFGASEQISTTVHLILSRNLHEF